MVDVNAAEDDRMSERVGSAGASRPIDGVATAIKRGVRPAEMPGGHRLVDAEQRVEIEADEVEKDVVLIEPGAHARLPGCRLTKASGVVARDRGHHQRARPEFGAAHRFGLLDEPKTQAVRGFDLATHEPELRQTDPDPD